MLEKTDPAPNLSTSEYAEASNGVAAGYDGLSIYRTTDLAALEETIRRMLGNHSTNL